MPRTSGACLGMELLYERYGSMPSWGRIPRVLRMCGARRRSVQESLCGTGEWPLFPRSKEGSVGQRAEEFDDLVLKARDALVRPGRRSEKMLNELRARASGPRQTALVQALAGLEAAAQESQRNERQLKRILAHPNPRTWDRLVADINRRNEAASNEVRARDRDVWEIITGKR